MCLRFPLAILISIVTVSSAHAQCVLFEHYSFDGQKLEMTNGQKIPGFHVLNPPFNDMASSVQVNVPNGFSKCTLTTYQDANYHGCERSYSSAKPEFDKRVQTMLGLGGYSCDSGTSGKTENDNASSAVCECE